MNSFSVKSVRDQRCGHAIPSLFPQCRGVCPETRKLSDRRATNASREFGFDSTHLSALQRTKLNVALPSTMTGPKSGPGGGLNCVFLALRKIYGVQIILCQFLGWVDILLFPSGLRLSHNHHVESIGTL